MVFLMANWKTRTVSQHAQEFPLTFVSKRERSLCNLRAPPWLSRTFESSDGGTDWHYPIYSSRPFARVASNCASGIDHGSHEDLLSARSG
jgi:hypothetical protein